MTVLGTLRSNYKGKLSFPGRETHLHPVLIRSYIQSLLLLLMKTANENWDYLLSYTIS